MEISGGKNSHGKNNTFLPSDRSTFARLVQMLPYSCGCGEKYWWEARSQKKGLFFVLFFVCVLKRIIAHLSSHKMPLSLFNGNINFFCILERRVMLTSSPSPGVFVYMKEGLSVCLHACVNSMCVCSRTPYDSVCIGCEC